MQCLRQPIANSQKCLYLPNRYYQSEQFESGKSRNLCCILGVPYPAKFDLPTDWTDTTFTLTWRVNCSRSAPIINYQLEFQEIPHGRWVVINIPAKIDYDRHRKHRNKRKKGGQNDVAEFKHTYTIKGLTKGSSYKVSNRIRTIHSNTHRRILLL